MKTYADLSSGWCRGMHWYLRRCEGLCSGGSFPHHVVNGLWLVLSDALALGYPTLMWSAHSVSCCIASTIQKMSLCEHKTRKHCSKEFVWFDFIPSVQHEIAAVQNEDERQCVISNMHRDLRMNKLYVNRKLKQLERLLKVLSNGFEKHWQH